VVGAVATHKTFAQFDDLAQLNA